MAKHTKRLFAIFIAALMCLMVQFPSLAAEEDGYFYDFNTDDPEVYFAGVSGWGGETANCFTICSWEDETDAAMWGQSVKYTNGPKNEQARFNIGGTYDKFAVEMSFRMDSASNAMHLNFYHSTDLYVLKLDKDMKVQLFGVPVTTYELGTWYDVKCWFDANQNYAHLWFKESSSDIWNEYDGFLGGDIVSTGTKEMFIEFHDGVQDDGGVKYFDNLKIYPITDDFEPSLSSYNDDFEDGVYHDSTVTDYTGYWKSANTNSQTSISAEPLEGYEGNVMKLKDISSDTAGVNLAVGKYPFTSTTTPDVRHKITFKIGSNFDSGRADVSLDFRQGHESSAVSEVTVLSLSEGCITMGDASEGAVFDDAAIEPGKLYDVEFIYDAKNSVAVLSVTDGNGDIHSSFLDMGLFGGSYGLLNGIEFANYSSAQNEVYVDDFTWDIHNAKFSFDGFEIKSGYPDSADINETVIFCFADIVAKEITPTVTVIKDGKSIDTPYVVNTIGNTVQIAFEELEKASDYTVELSDITGAFSSDSVQGSAKFTTSDYTVETESIAISDGTVTARIKGAYSGGFTAYLVAAAYDTEGNITEVKLLPVEVPYRTDDEVTFTPSFDGAYSFFKAMIIRDFGTAISYSCSVSSR